MAFDFKKEYKEFYMPKNKPVIVNVPEANYIEYIKLDRDKSTFKSHRDFSSEIEITFKHF